MFWEGELGIILEDPSNYVKQRIGGEKKEGLVLLIWWKVFIRSWLKNEQLYRLEVCADENTKVKFEEEDKGVVVKELVVEIENFPITSLNALAGIPPSIDYNTMSVGGSVYGQKKYILIDLGSTNNFMNEFTANKLGCKTTISLPVQ